MAYGLKACSCHPLTDHLAIHICTKCIIFHIDMDFWDQVGYQDTA